MNSGDHRAATTQRRASRGPLSWIRWQRVAAADIPLRDAPREARWLLGFALAYVGLAAGVGLLIRSFPMPLLGASKFTDDLWYLLVFKIGALLVIPWVAFLRAGYRPRDLLLGWRLDLRSSVSLLVAVGVGVLLNLGHLDRIAPALASRSPLDAATRVLLGIGVALVSAAIPEETVYRGMLQTRLEAVCNRACALAATALLFTAWHLPTRFLLSQGVEGEAGDLSSVLLGTGLPVLVIGMVFGWLWDRYRNMPTLIMLHWSIDALPAISSFVGIRW